MTHRERLIYLAAILVLGILLVGVSIRTARAPSQPSTETAYDADQEQYRWEISEFATNLEVPWDIGFDTSGTLYVTERPGRFKVFTKEGNKIDDLTVTNVASTGESGLTGLTLHPKFNENRYVYLYYSYRDSGELYNRVSRFVYQLGSLTNETVILNQLPGGSIHNGGRLRFGPDGKLWVLTGDAARQSQAQDKSSLAGKVLRLNEDGSVPTDNPTATSLVYSYGHRNPQGLAWHSLTEELFATEHGESAHDEVNLIKPDSNYGWPLERKCNANKESFVDPVFCSGADTLAPSGIASYGTSIWRFRNSFFVAGLRGNKLIRFDIVEGKIVEQETIIESTYGRLRAVSVGPDSALYVSTSNKDGRGKPNETDDKILKLTPILKK